MAVTRIWSIKGRAGAPLDYEIQKTRVSIRLVAPYSEERRKAASEHVKKNGIGKRT